MNKNVFFGALVLSILLNIALILVLKNKTTSDMENNTRKLNQLEQKLFTLSKQDVDAEKEFPLAAYMQRMLTHTNKLWFSGIEDNDELVHFYIHELEASLGDIRDANMVYSGVNITPLIQQFGIKGIETFEENIESGKSFEESYQLLITQCNNCHNSSKHSYIRIKVPETPSFDNQDYRQNN